MRTRDARNKRTKSVEMQGPQEAEYLILEHGAGQLRWWEMKWAGLFESVRA